MIIRIFRVEIHDDKIEAFRDFFLNTAVPLMKQTSGIEEIHFGLPMPETPNQFAIVMVWRDLDALRAFVGDDWQVPHIHPDEDGIVRERHLNYYELAA
jgi:heme-degrading monooxygenase HmoA